MNGVNKTLYIPLYGKALVSKKGIILEDKRAEKIWEKEGFKLGRKSRSKWLAYYMGMRSAVFDNWVKRELDGRADSVIIHIGCGMDSRAWRIGASKCMWYDVDFPEVIEERRRYYGESESYRMIATDVRNSTWLSTIPKSKSAIIVMEGVSMYLAAEEVRNLFGALTSHFEHISLLMDCYTVLAAKASRYKNPINDVGVTRVYGIDNPKIFESGTSLAFVGEHDMTPEYMINELKGLERAIFGRVYGGRFSKKLYKLYEYKK